MRKFKVGIVGATGMVGQRLITLLINHPWFELGVLAASPQSAGKTFQEAAGNRWVMESALPDPLKDMTVLDAGDVKTISQSVDFVFCAVSMGREETLQLEEQYARAEIPVISSNSACRMVPDVPMIIPEINAQHLKVIALQQKRLQTSRGFIVVKPNCSIQTYVPAITPLLRFEPTQIMACTYQAVSGAGRTLPSWPEMQNNVIPFIPGEEEKSEREPLKIWGTVDQKAATIQSTQSPVISAQCLRVPVADGHLAAVSVKFKVKPFREEILDGWLHFKTLPQELGLPSAPSPFLVYREEKDRPQPVLDRDTGNGMAVVMGRLREDPLLDWRFVCLSHNTLRGAAGGSVLTAELLCKQGYIR